MNAGAYGQTFEAVTERALVVTPAGSRWLDAGDIGFGERSSALPAGAVVAAVDVELTPARPEEIDWRVERNAAERADTQPSAAARTFGSVFMNPVDLRGTGSSVKAGELIDACGLRGARIGGARISPKHANWIENIADASAKDVLALMEIARARVTESRGIILAPEVIFFGAIGLKSRRRVPTTPVPIRRTVRRRRSM
jgi:UDP-N-acetylmuramate dehydrogenase